MVSVLATQAFLLSQRLLFIYIPIFSEHCADFIFKNAIHIMLTIAQLVGNCGEVEKLRPYSMLPYQPHSYHQAMAL